MGMSSWFSQNKKALFHSFGTFSFLFGIVILLVNYYDFSQANLGSLLFLTSILCCIFIAKNTFDVTNATDRSQALSESVAADLAVSSEELYVNLYKNSPVPYIIIDDAGIIKSSNIAAVRMLGVATNKVIGIKIFDSLKSDQVGHLDLIVQKYSNNIGVSDEMVKVNRSDHKEIWALMSLFGFKDQTGKKIGLLTLVDITKQKRAEDAKSEFVSLASHQLRTPIAGMKWSAELLKMDSSDNLTEQQNKYIDRLLLSVSRMAVLVDDFLRVSRFELGTFQPEYKPVTLSRLFKDIMSEQIPIVKQKKLSVKTFFDKDIDTIITDPNLMRMILTNLYSNAVKYTRPGGTIHFGFGRKDKDIVLTMDDNGMGIPSEDKADIFSKLFRAANAVRDVPDGTGLGLYIAREAVAVLKGSISFSTTENIGTTFEIVLPLELPGDRDLD